MTEINTHGLLCDFGRWKGTPYTQIPVSYLKWMVNANHTCYPIALAELERRNTVTPSMDITGHAIDTASIRCRKRWHETKKNKNEGLHAWLHRMALEALEKKDVDKKGRYHYAGIKFAFDLTGVWPVLKTVMATAKNNEEK